VEGWQARQEPAAQFENATEISLHSGPLSAAPLQANRRDPTCLLCAAQFKRKLRVRPVGDPSRASSGQAALLETLRFQNDTLAKPALELYAYDGAENGDAGHP